LSRTELQLLSKANALETLVGNRHQANWKALGFRTPLPLLPPVIEEAATPLLPRPKEGEEVLADFESVGLTLGKHPLALLRKYLIGDKLSSDLLELAQGAQAKFSGLVVVRQKPSSANGVIFLTVEDEMGSINAIIWPSLVDTYYNEVMHSKLLSISGTVQREGEVVHLIAQVLEDRSSLIGQLDTPSRNFC
jgi:error-prone DNA polymerase